MKFRDAKPQAVECGHCNPLSKIENSYPVSNSHSPMIRIIAVAWIALLLIAFALDRPVAAWVRDTVPVNKDHHITHLVLETVKLPGWFPVSCTIALLVGVFHRRHLLGAGSLVVSGVAVGAAYSIIKWVVGRHRPILGIAPWTFHPFTGGLSGLWREKGLCFPSGHASLAFSSAMCLAMLMPRFRWFFFLIGAATAFERVIENAHYLSDVVAGAGMGICLGWLITRTILSIKLTTDREDRGFELVPPAHRP